MSSISIGGLDNVSLLYVSSSCSYGSLHSTASPFTLLLLIRNFDLMATIAYPGKNTPSSRCKQFTSCSTFIRLGIKIDPAASGTTDDDDDLSSSIATTAAALLVSSILSISFSSTVVLRLNFN